MEHVFKFIIDARKSFIRLIDELSLEQLNEVPAGFNNNIIWNFGHIVVTAPVLAYVRTGISQDTASIDYLSSYGKGTKPTYFVSKEEVETLKQLAIRSIEQLEADYKAGKLDQITSFDTATYGAVLHSIEDVIVTIAGHDNTHLGYASAQKRIINN